MAMEIGRLTGCIERAVCQAEFTNVFGNRFDAEAMKELYDRKMDDRYRLSDTESIHVHETALRELVAELRPIVAPYVSSETGAIGNGLYQLWGSQSSPRLPSVEDYAKTLVAAAARLDPERVAGLIMEWTEGQPIRVWLCALLKGARTDRSLKPVDGLRLETLPSDFAEFPRSLARQIDLHDFRHEQYSHRAILFLEHSQGPVLYSPDDGLPESLEFPSSLTVRNSELASVSVDGLCRALSIEANSCVDWFRQWWDYGDTEAFCLNPGSSHTNKEASDVTPSLVTEPQLESCLELHGLLDGLTMLDLAIARWHRSKGAATTEEQLVELRIAMESILLADDRGSIGEKRHRLAIRGAWLLGKNFNQRKTHYRSLRDAYDLASVVIHAGSLKSQDREKNTRILNEAQDACRATIRRVAKAQEMPDWTDVILGKESFVDGHSA